MQRACGHVESTRINHGHTSLAGSNSGHLGESHVVTDADTQFTILYCFDTSVLAKALYHKK